MSEEHGTPAPRDRQVYLEEQIARQKRGEPIDVEWVRAELERVRRAQADKMAATQRNLRWLVGGSAALLLVLWLRRGGLDPTTTMIVIGVVLIGALAVWGLTRQRRG